VTWNSNILSCFGPFIWRVFVLFWLTLVNVETLPLEDARETLGIFSEITFLWYNLLAYDVFAKKPVASTLIKQDWDFDLYFACIETLMPVTYSCTCTQSTASSQPKPRTLNLDILEFGNIIHQYFHRSLHDVINFILKKYVALMWMMKTEIMTINMVPVKIEKHLKTRRKWTTEWEIRRLFRFLLGFS
jgi:hypothetical protein